MPAGVLDVLAAAENSPEEAAGAVGVVEEMVVLIVFDEIRCLLARIVSSASLSPCLSGLVFYGPLSPRPGVAFGFSFQLLSPFFGVRGRRLRPVALGPLIQRLVPTGSVDQLEEVFGLFVDVLVAVVVVVVVAFEVVPAVALSVLLVGE